MKYKITWYKGHLTEDLSSDFIDEVLVEKEVESSSIDEVSCLSILSEEEKAKYHHYKGGHGYVRGILLENARLYDYGSYNNFVCVRSTNV